MGEATHSQHRVESYRVEPGVRVYAIGDIHGRDDLLERMHAMIEADRMVPPSADAVVVYLGDYVDRGPCSCEVIDRLIRKPVKGCRAIHLRGNHEDMMLRFLDDAANDVWLANGGLATLLSYGVAEAEQWISFLGRDRQRFRDGLARLLPETHRRFLVGLTDSFVSGDYLFVHAGIRPGRPLDKQDPRDLMWIRGPFLACEEDFGKRVVHGHTITPEPEVLPNRIGIDTGAFFTGRLTCLVLEEDRMRFLAT